MDQLAEVFARVAPFTKSGPERLTSMAEALLAIEREEIIGDVVECGVWRGGNVMMARILAPGRTCWAYDTYDGMTEPDTELDIKPDGSRAIDRYRAKAEIGQRWNAVSMREVQEHFVSIGLDYQQVHFVEGPIELSLDIVSPMRISILRLDVDWYLPTKVAMEKLYSRLSPRGFLIVDDYGHWMGCRKAVDDYFGHFVPSFYDADYSCRVFRKP